MTERSRPDAGRPSGAVRLGQAHASGPRRPPPRRSGARTASPSTSWARTSTGSESRPRENLASSVSLLLTVCRAGRTRFEFRLPVARIRRGRAVRGRDACDDQALERSGRIGFGRGVQGLEGTRVAADEDDRGRRVGAECRHDRRLDSVGGCGRGRVEGVYHIAVGGDAPAEPLLYRAVFTPARQDDECRPVRSLPRARSRAAFAATEAGRLVRVSQCSQAAYGARVCAATPLTNPSYQRASASGSGAGSPSSSNRIP